MAKKIKAQVKVQINAGKATAAPPVGTALGPHGINMGQFIKEYNERTASLTGTIGRGAGQDQIVVTSHPNVNAGTAMPTAQIIGRTEVGVRMSAVAATGTNSTNDPPKKYIPAKNAEATKATARCANVSGDRARSRALTEIGR